MTKGKANSLAFQYCSQQTIESDFMGACNMLGILEVLVSRGPVRSHLCLQRVPNACDS